MKKEKDLCKDCTEYGSHFCPECLEEQDAQKKTSNNKPVDNPNKWSYKYTVTVKQPEHVLDIFGLVVYGGVLVNIDEGHESKHRKFLYKDALNNLRKIEESL